MEGPTKISAEEMDEAVRKVVLSFEIHPSQVARELGVSLNDIFDWVRNLSKEKIRYWSIGYIVEEKRGPGKGCGPYPVATQLLAQVIFLRRPKEKPCVAIIKKGEDGIELNPVVKLNDVGFEESHIVGFDYGPIPPLSQMSPKDADELWGTSDNKSVDESGVTCYRLVSTVGDEVVLELRFKGDSLTGYRVSGNSIGLDSKWCQV